MESQTPTEMPSGEAYEGTEATIVENEHAQEAEPIQEQVGEENDYSENLGGAHDNEYAPVEEDGQAQQEADAGEIPEEEAPGVEDIGGDELNDILGDLGIG